MEQLLEPIDLVAAGAIEQCSGDTNKSAPDDYEPLLSWVITGGESGHNARYCSLMWIHSIVNQCKATGIPVYVKQLGTEGAKQNSTHRSDTKGEILNSGQKICTRVRASWRARSPLYSQ